VTARTHACTHARAHTHTRAQVRIAAAWGLAEVCAALRSAEAGLRGSCGGGGAPGGGGGGGGDLLGGPLLVARLADAALLAAQDVDKVHN
jgi:hypothetical protein